MNKGSILYICLSEKWGSLERSVIRDAYISKQEGYNPILYTLRDSFLDIFAKQKKFETLYHTGRVQTNIVRWHKLRNLPGVLRNKKISIVHCYKLNFIWPMSFFLRGLSEIPLFVTQESEIKKNYNTVIHSLLLSRVDQVFIPFSPLEKNVRGQLSVPPRKVISLGYGVKQFEAKRDEVQKIKSNWNVGDEKVWAIGLNVPIHLKTIKSLKTAIYAVMGLNQNAKTKNKVHLILYSEKNWNQTLIYPDLIRFVKDLGVEEMALFYSGGDIMTFQQAVDVWLAPTSEEQVEDYSIQAMVQGTPVLVPRSTSSMEIFRLFGPLGETYKRDDSRQLRDQCLKILTQKKHYSRLLKNTSPKLMSAFGQQNYHQTLMHFYLHSVEVRKRLSRQQRANI